MTHSHIDYSVRFAIDPAAAAAMGTDELRHNFLIADLFAPGRISLTYTHYDRMIVGGAMPATAAWRWRRSSRPAPRISSTAAS